MCPAAHPPTILKFFLFSLSSVRCTQFFFKSLAPLKILQQTNEKPDRDAPALQTFCKHPSQLLSLCAARNRSPFRNSSLRPGTLESSKCNRLHFQLQNLSHFVWGWFEKMQKTHLGQKRSKGEAGWSTSSNCSVKKLQVVKGPIKLRQLLFHVSFFQHLPFPSKCYIFFVIPLIGL